MNISSYKNSNSRYTIRDSKNKKQEYLENLSKLNIFVGSNNSGKSIFLREMIKQNSNFVFKGNEELQAILVDIYNSLPKEIANEHNPYFIKDLKHLLSFKERGFIKKFNDFFSSLKSGIRRGQSTSGVGGSFSNDETADIILNNLESKSITGHLEEVEHSNIRYIPILRSLRDLGGSSNDIYLKITQSDYGFDDENVIFTGLTLYDNIKLLSNGLKSDRKKLKIFIKFLEDNFFEKQKVELTANHSSKVLYVNIGDEKDDKPIYDVGDGIQSIIINTFLAFENKDNELMLFIEEPEMMMHPSMQRTLIETLLNEFPKLQIFITTHSNHFLDLVYDYPEDVSIFSFEKKGEGSFDIKNISNYSKVIDLLGVRNSSVFLSNCVIWTEGVTDRMLIRKLLDLKDGFNGKEDKHYALAEYGGGNLENFDFINNNSKIKAHVKAISKNNFLVADNDGDHTSEKFKLLKKVFGRNLYYEHIEIENLIPFSVWKSVISDILSEHKFSYKLREDLDKNENSFNNLLSKEKIGVLLKKYVIENIKLEKTKYYENNGILCLGLGKKEIMDKIIFHINNSGITLNDFPKEAKNLIQKIKKFIEENN